MVNLVDNTRFLYVIISILLLQAITIISRNYKSVDKFTEKKKNTHWTSLIILLCQMFMVITAAFETILFDIQVTTVNYVGLLLVILVLIITYVSYKELGEHYSPNIEVKKKHKLIDTGIYKYIRHPMDLAELLFMIALPIAATAYFALIWVMPFVVVLSLKIQYEENLLSSKLRGYKAYMKRTKRLIPFII